MGKRLSKIVTRQGDDGSTGLGDGQRVGKDTARIELLGELDELNSVVGLLAAALAAGDELAGLLAEIQQDLFDFGGELCVPPGGAAQPRVGPGHIEALEQALERHLAGQDPLDNFVLPGGSEAVARCHLARAVCRRAERRLVALHHAEPVRQDPLRYLNRLGDLLFVLARRLGARRGEREILWRERRR